MKKYRAILILPLFTLGAGCTTNMAQEVTDESVKMASGPEAAPAKNYTKMNDSLRCMDRLLLENGIRDLIVLTEDINDNTKKLQVGSRDMLVSAVSDMTRRSRAVRLITFGGDVSNLVNWLNASGGNSNVYTTLKPNFDIRGSISQLDDNLAQKREGAGITVGPIDFDKSKDASVSILGLDMSIISTDTMEVMPGVVSRNTISLSKEGSGLGGGVGGTIKKKDFGINYDFSFNKNEGSSQAVRTLIELSTVELFGKLTRIPYWNCLGVDPDQSQVKDEMSDWYYALEAEGKLVPYVQNQLRIRGVYNGPINAAVITPEFKKVIPEVRTALGLNNDGGIDEAFFSKLINVKSKTLGAPRNPVAHLTVAQLSAKSKNRRGKTRSLVDPMDVDAKLEFSLSKPPTMTITAPPIKVGEPIQFKVKTPKDTFVYCYYQESNDNWMRIFPNRFQPDPFLSAQSGLNFPGNMKVEVKAAASGQGEKIACFNTSADISLGLPPEIIASDFEILPGQKMADLRNGFSSVAADNLSVREFDLKKR